MADRLINVWSEDTCAWEVVGALGLRESGGAVRLGLLDYNNHRDVDWLLEAVAALGR